MPLRASAEQSSQRDGHGVLVEHASSSETPDANANAVALARAERELTTILELSQSAVRVIDLAGRIVRSNAQALSASGEPPPGTVRELWEREQPHRLEDDVPLTFLECPAMRALADIVTRGALLSVHGSPVGDPLVLEVNSGPLHDDTGRVVGAVLLTRDVSERRRLERSLDQEALRSAALESRVMTEADRIERIVEERARAMSTREATLARDRRLAAVGQLAAGVMHDVNNALNPIMAAAYLLRHHAESPDAVREYADRIRIAAETGAATASRVGRFIRQEPMHAGSDQVLDLSVLAEEVLELTEPMRQGLRTGAVEVRVIRDYTSQVRTRGIPGEIREALLNLVSNAMDAMAPDGTLTVRTEICGDEAVVVVQDDGSGMSAEVRERAFEPFFTTKGAAGSGLGLAEVYGIVRRHRGTVTIVSAPGEGASVALHFPLERSAQLHSESASTPPPLVPLHLLVVEDHEAGREFLRRLLEANGHSVDAVASCTEARARLAAVSSAAVSSAAVPSAAVPSAAVPHAAFDLMLTDVGLPDGSGWDLVAFAREKIPALRVGVITGWEPSVSRAEAAGAEFVLRKPLRAAELLAHIAGHQSPALSDQ